jgi:isopentenyl diphosphate isomerase/L-lactate dehydrogenase-like FMN-dependent dehydrogenase
VSVAHTETGEALSLEQRFPTIDSIVAAAYQRIPAELWDYLSGGAESETTLRRNRAAFDRIALRPRILTGHTERRLNTSFLGHDLQLPVMLAPVGSIARYHPDGALACARAAERAGTVAFVSSSAAPDIEAVRAGSSTALFYQQYLRGGFEWLLEHVRRVEALGCAGICLTLDVNAPGHRERNLLNHFGGVKGAGSSSGKEDLFAHQADLSWDDIARLRERTRLPLILKGITSPTDAELAVEHGVDVIYASNHGGRQIDHMPSTIEVLPALVAAVAGRAEVVVDSGFIRGTDIVRALALGARAVLVGKLMVWSLAVAGQAGVECALGLLCQELHDALAHLGVGSVHELGPEHVAPTASPRADDWIGFRPGARPHTFR